MLSAALRILSLTVNLPGAEQYSRMLLGDHRQRALRQIAEVVGEIGIDGDMVRRTVAAVLAERHLAQEEVPYLVDAVLVGKIERVDDIADRFRTFLAPVQQEAVGVDPLRHGMPADIRKAGQYTA